MKDNARLQILLDASRAEVESLSADLAVIKAAKVAEAKASADVESGPRSTPVASPKKTAKKKGK
jgi:hypothetical protein